MTGCFVIELAILSRNSQALNFDDSNKSGINFKYTTLKALCIGTLHVEDFLKRSSSQVLFWQPALAISNFQVFFFHI